MDKPLLSLILLLLLMHSFGETRCPLGWTIMGEKKNVCVRASLAALTREEAEQRCREDGAELISTEDREVMQDLTDLLDSLYDDGLIELEWLVRSDTQNEATILQRNNDTYNVGHISPTSSLPFVCALTQAGLRTGLLRDELIPRGAPKIAWDMRGEVFFSVQHQNEMLPLRCPFSGSPQPKLTWYRNDVAMTDHSSPNISFLISGGTLLLTPTHELAYSSFHCVAQSALGTARSPPVVLKPAFLDAFPLTRLDSFPLLDGGANLPCHAPAHQPKSLTYSWLYKNEEDSDEERSEILKQDERVFISIDGTLMLSHVHRADERRYACSIRVPTTESGHYGPFFRLVVPGSLALTYFSPRIDPGHPKVFPDIPLRKETVYLECFAYANPSPSYGWARADGRGLPVRSLLLNHGRVLRIEAVETGDGGRYVCTAGNDRGVATAQVTLVVRDVPKLVAPLIDTLVATGENLMLDCPLSTADTTSTVEWFKNDKPLVRLLLSHSQRKRITTSGTALTISPVEKEDAGVYTCIASNDIGSSSSSALVEVRDLAPVFPSLALPAKIFAVKGSNLVIPCTYQASPVGHSQWTNAGGKMIEERHGRIRVDNRVLRIDDVQKSDEGPYFCSARNRLGKAHTVTHVVVIDSPDVRLSSHMDDPHSPTVNITCEVDLSCTGDDCPEPLFEWTLNDEPLHISPLRHSVTPHIKERHIHGKRIRHKMDLAIEKGRSRVGRFACSSLFGAAKSEMAQWHTVPPSPIGVRVERRQGGRGRVLIRWNMPPTSREAREKSGSGGDSRKETVDGYIVEYRTKNDRRWKNISRRNVESMGERSASVEELAPNTYYQFRVRSLSSSQRGDASAPSDWIQTSPAPPIEAIEGLRWTAKDAATILVEWDPIEREQSSGTNLRYRVSWGDEKTASINTIETRIPSSIIRVNSSDSCSSILISVIPLNDEGIATTAVNTVAFLNAKGEIRDVTLTNATALNSTAVFLSWKWQEDHCHALYAVEVNCTSAHSIPVTTSVSSDHSSFELAGLAPSLTYSCHLRPFDKRGHFGKTSNAMLVSTDRPAPVDAPLITLFGWRQEDDGSLTTVMEWTPVPFERGTSGNRTMWGYKVYIAISDTFTVFDLPEDQLANPSKPSVKLEGLQVVYTYVARVAAYNSGGVGPQSEAKSIRLGLRYFQLVSAAGSTTHFIPLLLILLYSWVR
ncbi:hypothetical protein PFISCL1PPCAC_16665 [Pristionchus fissidentatus]|uniref:Uncharacterized protein n=1 Tax=Pristionchus fissidentatus TaxID=1538716 RepID=A0AAV5W1A9_9BILA|nr:hypothetical protein PFISCL1PPCAC_16665 [Pristionchus fissidentatus]